MRTRHRDGCFLLEFPENNHTELCTCGAQESDYAKEETVWSNIITTSGELHYAELLQAGAFANTGTSIGTDNTASITVQYDSLVTGTAGNVPGATSNYSDITAFTSPNPQQLVTALYPLVNDGDADNGGAGTDTLSWRFAYATANGNGTIDRVAIVAAGATGTAPLLHYAVQTAFTPTGSIVKTSSDTLTFFVNVLVDEPTT
jgi:hypothetical protein